MFPRSIRWRLQLWHGSILLLVLLSFGFTAHRLQWANEMRRIDQELDQRASQLLRTLRNARPGGRPFEDGSPPPPERARARMNPIGPEQRTAFSADTGFYFLVWRRDGLQLDESTNAPAGLPAPSRPDDSNVPTAPRRIRQRGMMREVFVHTPPGECVLVGASLVPVRARVWQMTGWLAGAGGFVLLLGLAGGWVMASRAMRPVDEISATAGKIAAGNLAERIHVGSTDDELGRLAAVLNSTFARLDSAFARQQQFTADASHELRTPISVILNQSQSALARERSAEDYREALGACQRAAQRMRRLTESLLTLARLDAGAEGAPHEQCDLARIVAEAVELLGPLAAGKGIAIQTRLEKVECPGNPESLSQVMANLLTNAIDHNRERGEVLVTSRAEEGFAVVSVTDTGPGIAARHLPHVFERFYRADAARTGSQGNTGLGLAICKAIVEAHGGTIEAASPPGAGAEFIVRLPRGGD